MGAGPSGIFLDRSSGQRLPATHHADRLRGSAEVRRDPQRQQSHCSLHAGHRPGCLYASTARNLRIKLDRWMNPHPLWRRVAGVVGRGLALLLVILLTGWTMAALYFDL